MTCHVAAANQHSVIILADSQASGPDREAHGNQKIFAGDGYVLGGAGLGLVVNAVFETLSNATGLSSIEDEVARYLEDNVRPAAVQQTQFICGSQATSGTKLSVYTPAIFRAFTSVNVFTSIGSGADFAFAAIRRDAELGIQLPRDTLADLFVLAETYATVADESLTVDNELMAGVVTNGRSYLFPGQGIQLRFAAPAVLQNVAEASRRWTEIRAALATFRSELRVAQNRFSAIRSRLLTPLDGFQLE